MTTPIVLNQAAYDNFKGVLGMTDEEMAKYYVVSDYIEADIDYHSIIAPKPPS